MALFLGSPSPPGYAQALPGHQDQEILVEALDAKGQVITSQLSSRLEVLEDGERLPVQDLGEVGNRWRIVLYFDQLLASPTDFHNATIQLGERARDLTRLGSVELLLAGQEVSAALPENREPDALSQALGWLRLRDTSENLQMELRQSFLEKVDPESGISAGLTPEWVAELAQNHIKDESELLRRFREQLLLWAVSHTTPGPKALFLIGTGFDDDPLTFYQEALAENGWAELVPDLRRVEVEPSVTELGQVLSVYGWTILPYTPGQRGDTLLDETEEELAARKEDEVTDVIFQDGQMVDKTTIGFDPADVLKKRRERRAAAQERPLLLNAEYPYRILADSTGGELLRGKFQLSDLLVRLSQRSRIGLAAADNPPGTVAKLETKVDLGSEGEVPLPTLLRSRRWISRSTPEVVSAVRARQVLAERLDEGDLVDFSGPAASGEGRRVPAAYQARPVCCG